MKRVSQTLLSRGAGATRQIGLELGRMLFPGAVLGLTGDLGSGKTVFVQGLARGLGLSEAAEVRSPTFALIQEHSGPLPLCHADLYRVSAEETLGLGLEEYAGPRSGWVVAVEWADRMGGWLDKRGGLTIAFETQGARARKITLSGGQAWEKIIRALGKKFSRSKPRVKG